ncbi:MAG: hypothetical protein LBD75_08205, partial [Candidatus Peribacteria bacterium]|nr:hypothetical protein [Candidatus Peribacteria bacterium]
MKKMKKIKKILVLVLISALLASCEKGEEYLLSELSPHWTLDGQAISDGSVIHITKNGDKTLELTVSGVSDRQVVDIFLDLYLNGRVFKKYKNPIATLASSQEVTSVSFCDEGVSDYEVVVQFVSRNMNAIKYNRFIIRIDEHPTPPTPPPPPSKTYSFTFNGNPVVNGATLTIPSTTTCYLQLQVSGLQTG